MCVFGEGVGSDWMLTIWVHMVPGHLWGGEPLLERVCAVTVLIHGDQLLLRRSQRCEGVHHPLHPIRHYFCEKMRSNEEKTSAQVCRPCAEEGGRTGGGHAT